MCAHVENFKIIETCLDMLKISFSFRFGLFFSSEEGGGGSNKLIESVIVFVIIPFEKFA